MEDQESIHIPKHLFSRLLYPNPVCLLTTKTQEAENVMTITWLTCLNNHGKFLCSIQNKRFSLEQLKKNQDFVLNIPVKGMEDLILYIGSFHGSIKEPKLPKVTEAFPNDFHLCEVGWKPAKKSSKNLCIRECVAHLCCTAESEFESAGHHVITCQITDAWVKSSYWHQGKLFMSSPLSPPLLTFLGSQQFGEMTAHHITQTKEEVKVQSDN